MLRASALVAFVGGLCLVAGCAASFQKPAIDTAQNRSPARIDTGSVIARAALDVVGTPYRYGGGDRGGFDCSGLVQFAHIQAGISIPRTTASQYRATTGKPRELRIGDVLFFRIRGQVSHNGIYVGDGRFVHAPSTGKTVSISRTDNPYFRKRLAGVRRFH